MNRFLLSLSFLLFLFTFSYAQFPITVNEIEVTPNTVAEYDGNLEDGRKITNLNWASRSSVACFPATQNSKFDGNHVQHGFVLPPNSEVTITVEPHNRKADFSMYGYQVSTAQFPVVPNLYSCRSCEADYKWDYPKRGQTQDHTRSIKMNSFQNSYNVFIGVAGANGLLKCDYTLKIYIKTSEKPLISQEKIKVFKAASELNKTKVYRGDLADGVKVHDLSWASSSSNACFPATQNSKFTGNHILYVTEIPEYSQMDITIIPTENNANMSVYAFMNSLSSDAMVPNLSSCISCEADYKWEYPKRGQIQDHTRTVSLNSTNRPYRIVIGVAGADGLTQGDFIVKIKTLTNIVSNEPQKPLKLYSASSEKGKTKGFRGNLADGVKVQDLSWASLSTVSCFPATQNSKFTGNQILYVTEISAHSNMEITVIPEDKNANMSIYAYMTSLDNKSMIPKLNTCLSCEADYKWDYPKSGQIQDHTRSVNLNSGSNSNRVVIGIAGANGMTEGKY
ncbi:hypothetical protein OAK19_03800, partial [Aureispira]|nr:hypothetical protein [Aureispira sp.]